MLFYKKTTVWALLVLALFCGNVFGFQDSQLPVQNFILQYVKAAQSPVLKKFTSFQCSSYVTSKGGNKTQSWEDSVQGDFWKHTTSIPGRPDKIIIRNPTYSFDLQKKENGFLLIDLTHNVEFARLHSIFVSPVADRWAARSLADIFGDSKTKFHRVRRVKFQGFDAIEVAVEFPIVGRVSNKEVRTFSRTQRYFLHAENFLLLGACSLIDDTPFESCTHTLVSYSPKFDSIEKIVEVLVEEDGSREVFSHVTIEVQKMLFESVNEEECYLSYYGIPEPVGEPSRSREYTWAWVVVSAVLVLGLILVFWSYRK